ncbi:CRISPR system single-strand-specific deoxyribonuclease Cas10/Csm1 (subtype III-A) [subsurface metagenome]
MKDKFQLVFGALLHDIGKLGYRAGERGSHEEIGARVTQGYDDVLPKVNSLISLHHQRDIGNVFEGEGYNLLKKVIIADWLASAERIEVEERKEVRKVGLSPVFSKINLFNKEISRHKFVYLGKELELKNGSEEIFPLIENEASSLLERYFLGNWNLFKKKFQRVGEYKDDFEALFDFLYSLVKTHFKFVPSAAYFVEPDVSLFDHSKIVCAIALAIHNYFKAKSVEEKEEIAALNNLGKLLQGLYREGDRYRKEIEKDKKLREVFKNVKFFALIHGDFSGIQKFIHLISSKSAMKTLKGRSFFFTLLTENFARFIVQQLELTEANIIFAGGGHFYIISHCFDELESKIREFSIKINALFIEELNSRLFLALDFVPLSVEGLRNGISEIWESATRKTSNKKLKKFNDIISTSGTNYFSKIFGPIHDSALKTERCVVCNSYSDLEPIERGGEDQWCSQCRSFKELTVRLKSSKFYRITQDSQESYNDVLKEFNNAVEFADLNTASKKDLKTWCSINNPSFEKTIGDKLLPIGFPLNENKSIIDNDQLGEKSKERTGFNKIAVLKMDVDSLGKIFQRGLRKNYSLSRVSTLSTSLSLFFRGYVSKLVETSYPDSIYLIFSGGDDLFAMGAWDKVIEFAFELYRAFRKFTAYNPDITLSAGVVLESPKFPIIHASMVAEEQLDNAKYSEPYSSEFNTKNKITLFGSVLKWDWTLEKELEHLKLTKDSKDIKTLRREQIIDVFETKDDAKINAFLINWLNDKSEFELSLILKDVLTYLLVKKDFSKSMLHKLETSIIGVRKLLEDSLKRKVNVPKLWRLKYYLRKVLGSKDREVRLLSQFIVYAFEIIIKNNLFKTESNLQIKNVEFITVAIKWADYLTRK